MRILYCALDQTVPGTVGGSVHVQAVAEGLAELGHEVHVLTGLGGTTFPDGLVHWHALSAPMARPHLRLLRAGQVRRLAHRLSPDVVIERYHNFGGEGVLAGRATGAPVLLEVNAPIVDYPGSPKAGVDRVLVAEPMRRWRDWLCDQAALIVTPSAAILPDHVPTSRVLELEWGADTSRFTPDASGTLPYARSQDEVVAVFAGAFRPWHGAIQIVDAMRLLHARGATTVRAVLIGDGPERRRVAAAARDVPSVELVGAVPHEQMPAALAGADIGVAPFDVARHPPLGLAFYWSPLKLFEYMASGLPVIAPALPRLRSLVADGIEGVLYAPATANALADAIGELLDRTRLAQMGEASRSRAVRDYSWQAHCRALERAITSIVRVPHSRPAERDE
jgi:glycosyltransferase involved in cell wall biosynthesis